jgi:hypothetical protein
MLLMAQYLMHFPMLTHANARHISAAMSGLLPKWKTLLISLITLSMIHFATVITLRIRRRKRHACTGRLSLFDTLTAALGAAELIFQSILRLRSDLRAPAITH